MLKDKIYQHIDELWGFHPDVTKALTNGIFNMCLDYFKECIEIEKENAELKQQLSSMPDKDNEIIGGE